MQPVARIRAARAGSLAFGSGMPKLNFGCGTRVADGWTNIDFHPSDARVRQVNLLQGFPYPDNSFEAVYSSHVLEHFTPTEALFLLREARRVLKPGGVLRAVVPDLAGTCREYLRILDLPDADRRKGDLYEWIVIELLDQLVRARPSGEMGPYLERLKDGADDELSEYVRSRTEHAPRIRSAPSGRRSLAARLRRLPDRLATRMGYWRLAMARSVVPKALRSMVLVETSIGERHRWMYDFYGLSRLCSTAGFAEPRSLAYDESAIPGLHADHLDSNHDGSSYKRNSIYLEAIKRA